MSSRVYIGHLNSRASERDVEHFCRGFGRIRDVVLKSGFGFVEFDDIRDAEDAVHELNGRDLLGDRVIVELSRRTPRGPGGNNRYNPYDHRGGDRRGPPRGSSHHHKNFNSRYGPPVQTRYRMIVENLSTRCSWQDLKDLMRHSGEVTYADAHKKERNVALVCFGTHEDLKRAIAKNQGKDINGRKIKLIDDSQVGDRRYIFKIYFNNFSRSRSRSPRSRSRTRSRSRSRSYTSAQNGRSRSRSASRSRSRSVDSRRSERSNGI